jgi:hypothetical protein
MGAAAALRTASASHRYATPGPLLVECILDPCSLGIASKAMVRGALGAGPLAAAIATGRELGAEDAAAAVLRR